MTASDYAHLSCDGNRLGLHYSLFWGILKISRLKISHLRNENILFEVESAKSG
jgi:hypothetical protein